MDANDRDVALLFDRPLRSPMLIGRATQARALARALDAARGGVGQCVIIHGEAGVGKSRLIAEACADVARDHVTLLQGNCFEPDGALPFGPVIDLLRTWCAAQPVDQIKRVLGAAPTLLGLLPELHMQLPDRTTVPTLDSDQEKRHLFHELTQTLTALASPLTREAPPHPVLTLVILEDLHWCDTTTLEWLHSLVRRIAGTPILLALTYRSDEVNDNLRHFLATLDRARLVITEIALQRLDVDDVQTMIAAIFQQPRPVRREFVAAIHALTDGNPFFVEETLKSLVISGDIFLERGTWTRKPIDELSIPRTVQDAVQWRVRRLSPDAGAVLRLAAVMGRRFDFDTLRDLAGGSEAEMLETLKILIAAQLVVEESGDLFAFRHALTRAAIYTGMLARERRPLHRTIAEALERRFADQLDAHTADLAYHFYQARVWPKAVGYAQRAGEHAQSLFSPQAAAEQFTRAIQAAEQLGGLAPAALYHARGRAYELLGAFDPARADYDRAITIARAAGERVTEWQSLLDLGFLWVGQEYARAGMYLQQALDAARAMDDPSKVAQTLNRIGNWQLMIDEPARSLDCHLEALAIFQAADDWRGLASTLDLLGIASFMRGDMLSGARYYERAIGLWRALGERQWLIPSLATFATRGGNSLFATAVCQPSDLAQCIGEVEEALDLARQIGWLNGQATALLWMGHALAPRGEWARAIVAAQAALELAQTIDHVLWIVTAQAIFGIVMLDLFAFDQAREWFERALELAHKMHAPFVILTMSGLLASALTGQQRYEQAEATLNAVSDSNLPMQSQAQQRVWHARATLALARGDAATARQIVERLNSALDGTGQLATAHVIPRLELLRGEALAMLGEGQAAEAALHAARDAAIALDARPLRWRIHAALAGLHRTWRRHELAASESQAAREIIQALATQAPDPDSGAAFARQALDTLPKPRALTPRRATQQAFGGLTEREREVAALVAQGRTTRAIAVALALSERTVEKHIENLMAKLGVDTRTQIGVWAAAHGLTNS